MSSGLFIRIDAQVRDIAVPMAMAADSWFVGYYWSVVVCAAGLLPTPAALPPSRVFTDLAAAAFHNPGFQTDILLVHPGYALDPSAQVTLHIGIGRTGHVTSAAAAIACVPRCEGCDGHVHLGWHFHSKTGASRVPAARNLYATTRDGCW